MNYEERIKHKERCPIRVFAGCGKGSCAYPAHFTCRCKKKAVEEMKLLIRANKKIIDRAKEIGLT